MCAEHFLCAEMGRHGTTQVGHDAQIVHPDSQKPRLYLGSLNGAKETRTPDPLHAMQAIYCSKSIV